MNNQHWRHEISCCAGPRRLTGASAAPLGSRGRYGERESVCAQAQFPLASPALGQPTAALGTAIIERRSRRLFLPPRWKPVGCCAAFLGDGAPRALVASSSGPCGRALGAVTFGSSASMRVPLPAPGHTVTRACEGTPTPGALSSSRRRASDAAAPPGRDPIATTAACPPGTRPGEHASSVSFARRQWPWSGGGGTAHAGRGAPVGRLRGWKSSQAGRQQRAGRRGMVAKPPAERGQDRTYSRRVHCCELCGKT